MDTWTPRPTPSTSIPTENVRPLIISLLPPHEQGERGSDKDQQGPHGDQGGIGESVGRGWAPGNHIVQHDSEHKQEPDAEQHPSETESHRQRTVWAQCKGDNGLPVQIVDGTVESGASSCGPPRSWSRR